MLYSPPVKPALLLVLVLSLVACGKTSTAQDVPNIAATAQAPFVGCEDKKRDFVAHLTEYLNQTRPLPAGMFVSSGSYDPKIGSLVIEGNGLTAIYVFGGSPGNLQVKTYTVACTAN